MSDSISLTHEQREQLGRAALDWALKYFNEQSQLPVYPTIGADALSSRLSSSLPHRCPGHRHGDVRLRGALSRTDATTAIPRMFGYVQSSASFAGVAADFLASALNQNVTSWRSAPSATTIEHQVIDWLKDDGGLRSACGRHAPERRVVRELRRHGRRARATAARWTSAVLA